jgi:prepilin-type N-terminal cleavage/methylation domain-containing protein
VKPNTQYPQSPGGPLPGIPNTQYGFTLVELLVAIGLASLVTGLLVSILYQFMTVPRRGNAQLAVSGDLRNAGLWLVRDGNESLVFSGTPGTCTPFTFDTGPERGVTYTYTLDGKTLNRQNSATGRTIGVARHVGSVQCPPGTITGTLGITLVASNGDVSASQTFTVTTRVDE